MNTETPPTIQEEELHEAPASSDFDYLSASFSSGYTDEELEEERTSLCLAQGISRFC